MTRNARAYSAYDPSVAPVAVHPVRYMNQLWLAGSEALDWDEFTFVDNVSSAMGLLPAVVRALRGWEEAVENAEEAMEEAEEAVEKAEGAE